MMVAPQGVLVEEHMNREQLVRLRDAIGIVLAWHDSVRAEIARWLNESPPMIHSETAKPGNGIDPRRETTLTEGSRYG
jgi:hypothetical protein